MKFQVYVIRAGSGGCAQYWDGRRWTNIYEAKLFGTEASAREARTTKTRREVAIVESVIETAVGG